jgi:hypothetical protein
MHLNTGAVKRLFNNKGFGFHRPITSPRHFLPRLAAGQHHGLQELQGLRSISLTPWSPCFKTHRLNTEIQRVVNPALGPPGCLALPVKIPMHIQKAPYHRGERVCIRICLFFCNPLFVTSPFFSPVKPLVNVITLVPNRPKRAEV